MNENKKYISILLFLFILTIISFIPLLPFMSFCLMEDIFVGIITSVIFLVAMKLLIKPKKKKTFLLAWLFYEMMEHLVLIPILFFGTVFKYFFIPFSLAVFLIFFKVVSNPVKIDEWLKVVQLYAVFLALATFPDILFFIQTL